MTAREYEVLTVVPPVGNENKTGLLAEAMHSVLRDEMHLVKALKGGQEICGFEIYATASTISTSFIVPKPKVNFFKDRLFTVFKGCDIKPGGDYLHFTPKESYVCGFHLKHHYLFSLNAGDACVFRSIVDSLDNLVDNQRAVVQMLFEPLDSAFNDNLSIAYKQYTKGELTQKGSGLLELVGNGAKAVGDGIASSIAGIVGDYKGSEKEIEATPQPLVFGKKKVTQKLFRASIRVVAEGGDSVQRDRILSGVCESLKELNAENAIERSLVAKPFVVTLLEDLEHRRMPLFPENLILSQSEVANLIKIADDGVMNPKVERVNVVHREVDSRVTEGGILIGHTPDHRGTPKPVYYVTNPPDDYCKPRVYTAAMGGGKTTQAEVFVKGVAAAGDGCSVFDVADGKLIERCLATIPEERVDDVIVVDFSNIKRPPVFNFSSFASAAMYEEDEIGAMFVEFFKEFWGTGSYARTNTMVRKAAMTAFCDPNSTFLEVLLLLTRKEFREKFIPKIKHKNKRLYMWWMTEFSKLTDGDLKEIIAPVMTRLDQFLEDRKLKNIFCATGGQLTPRKWMDEGKIVLFKIPKGVYTDYQIRIIMAFINYAYWTAALSRRDITDKFLEPKPHHLVFDEPQDYFSATDIFSKAFAQSRKYRVSYNLFFQSADQIIEKDKSFWKIMMDNKPHLVLGPTSEATVKQIINELAPLTLKEVLAISKMPFHFVLRTFAKGSIDPLVFRALPPTPDKDLKDRSYIKTRSLAIYNPKSASDIEEEVDARELMMSIQEYRKILDSYDQESEEVGFQWAPGVAVGQKGGTLPPLPPRG